MHVAGTDPQLGFTRLNHELLRHVSIFLSLSRSFLLSIRMASSVAPSVLSPRVAASHAQPGSARTHGGLRSTLRQTWTRAES